MIVYYFDNLIDTIYTFGNALTFTISFNLEYGMTDRFQISVFNDEASGHKG